jgi:hypothetical protein
MQSDSKCNERPTMSDISFNVRFEDGKPVTITNEEVETITIRFVMDGTTAVMDEIKHYPSGYDEPAYLNAERLREITEAVAELDFVQAVEGL